MIVYNTDGMIRQRFPFRDPIMHYIIKNAQPQHLLKLYQSCKFFYHKIGVNVIQNLEIVADNEPEICSSTFNSLRVSTLSKFNNFWITESFTLPANIPFLPGSLRFAIKKLVLTNNVSLSLFQMFTKDGNIKELKIENVFVDDDSTLYLGIEYILAMVPNATSIEFSKCNITPTTYASLIELNHKAKFSNFVLKNIDNINNFDIGYRQGILADFLLKNANYNCNVYLDFQPFPDISAEARDLNRRLKILAFITRKSLTMDLYGKKMKDLIKENMMMILFFLYCLFIFYS